MDRFFLKITDDKHTGVISIVWRCICAIPNPRYYRGWTILAVALVSVLPACNTIQEPVKAEPSAVLMQVTASLDDPLPVSDAEAKRTLKALHAKYRRESGGKVADHTDVAAAADPNAFGIVIATVDGRIIQAGDAKVVFPLQSLSKAFIFGLALEDNGNDVMLEKVGVYATGLPYGSLAATEVRATMLQNPMVSAGAIAVTSTIAGSTTDEKWRRALTILQNFAGRNVKPISSVYTSEMAKNTSSLAKAWVLHSYGLLYAKPMDTVDRYLYACSVGVTTEDLAIMGATLANGGVNPKTGKRVVSAETVRGQLSAMVTAGMYDYSGPWLFNIGLPAKSGVGGGVVAVVPNRFAIAVFSPPLDLRGNSVRATKVIEDLSDLWELHVLQGSRPKN